MAITYQQLRTVNLSSLSDAVDAWRRLPGQFDTIARSFGSTVTKGLRDSDWKGETATEALEKFDLIEKQMKAASDEAHDVHTLLRSALDAFQAAKNELKKIEKYVAEDKYLKITSEGRVYCDPSAAPVENRESLSKGYFNAVQDCNKRVESVLKDADDADSALHYALTSDPNGSARGFNTDTATTIKEAEQRRKEALQDAKAMVELARKGATSPWPRSSTCGASSRSMRETPCSMRGSRLLSALRERFSSGSTCRKSMPVLKGRI